MRAVVSFSLFGTDPDDIYYRGAIENARMYQDLYPEWQTRFYVGQSVPRQVRDTLMATSAVIPLGDPEDQTATFWRFLALRDPSFDAYLFRDVDGRPLPRELSAVDEWLASDKQFHVMRDHPRHGTEILAGLWGVKARYAATLAKRLPDRLYDDYYQVDQDFLRLRVWRHAKWDLMAHVGCRWTYGVAESRPFPVKRSASDFYAGECRLGDGSLRFPEHRAEVLLDIRHIDS